MSHFRKQNINVAKQDITENEFYIYMQTLAVKALWKENFQLRRLLFHEHKAKTLNTPNGKINKICRQVRNFHIFQLKEKLFFIIVSIFCSFLSCSLIWLCYLPSSPTSSILCDLERGSSVIIKWNLKILVRFLFVVTHVLTVVTFTI